MSTTEYPIRILKIESGSLLASILGHSEVVNLLTKFIGSAATYIYGNYTDNGKLNSIPRKVETIDSVLKLRDNLKNSGIAIDDMDENISKAAVAVAKDLNALISGEAKIKLNDRVISVGEEVQKKMIENKETLTLSHERNAEPPADAVGLPRLPDNTGPEKL